MALRADQWNQLSGTMAAGGSLSQVIDTSGYDLQGLIARPVGTLTLTAGTIQFRVGVVEGTLYPLVDGANARVGLPISTTGVAFSFVAVQAIRPYRYVQVEHSTAMVNGATITLPVKLG